MGLIYSQRRGMQDKYGVIMTKASNAQVLAICYAQGWCTSQYYMTKAEAEAVTDVGLVFYNKSAITHFEEFQYFTGITSLNGNGSSGAFESCINLRNIILPQSLTSIGQRAFEHCRALSYLDIPSACTSISDNYTFYNNAANFTLNFNNDGTYYYNISRNESPYVYTSSIAGGSENGMLVYNNILVACPQKSSNVTIPQNITTIGQQCFFGYDYSKDLFIPETVTSIQSTTGSLDGCFKNAMFRSIILSSNVASIPQRCFYTLTNLYYFVIKSTSNRFNVNSDYGISGLSNLKYLWVPNSVISSRASLLTSKIPANAEILPIHTDWGGERISGLTEGMDTATIAKFDFQSASTTYNIYSFQSGSGDYHYRMGGALLTGATLNLPVSYSTSLLGFTAGTFYSVIYDQFDQLMFNVRDSKLIYVRIQSGYTSIMLDQFRGCDMLTTVKLPSTVTTIRSGAFAGCRSLTSINIGSVTTIDDGAFYECERSLPRETVSAIEEINPRAFEEPS